MSLWSLTQTHCQIAVLLSLLVDLLSGQFPLLTADFEHNTLARYKVIDDDEKQEHVSRSRTSRVVRKKPFVVKVIDALSKGQKKLERAQPGEDTVKTRLYSPLWTPQRQLGDFGIGTSF